MFAEKMFAADSSEVGDPAGFTKHFDFRRSNAKQPTQGGDNGNP